MKSFNDNDGRTWEIRINVDALKRVRGLLDIDLTDIAGGELLGRLADDPILLCDVIYAVCKPDAEARSITDEQFGRAMGGDVIDEASTALLEGLIEFFPTRKRQVLSQALEKLRKVEGIALDAAATKLASPEIEQQMQAMIEESLEPTSGKSSTSSPGPSE